MHDIGIGAGPAGLAGPLFQRFNEIHYRYWHAHRYRRHVIGVRLLQPDHFKSPSYDQFSESYMNIVGVTPPLDKNAITNEFHFATQFIETFAGQGV